MFTIKINGVQVLSGTVYIIDDESVRVDQTDEGKKPLASGDKIQVFNELGNCIEAREIE